MIELLKYSIYQSSKINKSTSSRGWLGCWPNIKATTMVAKEEGKEKEKGEEKRRRKSEWRSSWKGRMQMSLMKVMACWIQEKYWRKQNKHKKSKKLKWYISKASFDIEVVGNVGQSPRNSVSVPVRLGLLPIKVWDSRNWFRQGFITNRNLAGSYF